MSVMNALWKKLGVGTVRSPGARSEDHLGVEREQERRHVRRGIGVGDRATDRAPIADLDVADAATRRP